LCKLDPSAFARRRNVLAVLAAVLLLAAPASAADARRKVAVLGLKGGPGIAQSVAELVTETLVAGIQQRPGLKVISTQDIETALRFEQKKQLLGCADSAACLAEIGGSLGVEWIVSGTLGKLGNSIVFNAQVVDIRTGSVVQRCSSRIRGGTEESFLDAAEEAVTRLFPSETPPAVPKPPSAPPPPASVAIAPPAQVVAPPAPPVAAAPAPPAPVAEKPAAAPNPRRWSVGAGGSAVVLKGPSQPTAPPGSWSGAWHASVAVATADWLELRLRVQMTPRADASRFGLAAGVRAAPLNRTGRVRPYLALDAETDLSSGGHVVGVSPALGVAVMAGDRLVLSVEARALWLLAHPDGADAAYLFVAPTVAVRL